MVSEWTDIYCDDPDTYPEDGQYCFIRWSLLDVESGPRPMFSNFKKFYFGRFNMLNFAGFQLEDGEGILCPGPKANKHFTDSLAWKPSVSGEEYAQMKAETDALMKKI